MLKLNWISIGTGAMLATLIFALMNNNEDEEYEEDVPEEELTINDSSGRHVILSCQTCRKLKKHKELEHYLFQCVKCKRHVDIRKAS